MRHYVLQTRWIGDDDWTNAIFVADTEEAAKQQALDAENQQKRENYEDDREYGGETGNYKGDWTSLEHIGKDTGEFLYSGWYIE